ncbi:MAG: aminotransferase class I/II-fold pyridoxal phosphate-dependent enzyme [Deltaproteobacteria bacterium]|nr:aminotransferase class I/II-fold pyridoxal phosphate-dependent enzyme [Deltaproteobacteria bacterium]
MIPVPFALERYFAAHEFSAQRLLSSSDCDALSLDDVLAHADDDVTSRWQRLSLGYTESRGLPLLRQEIARQYRGVDVDDVLCVVPQEGVLLGLSALVEPGVRVIATVPAYQSLIEVVRHRGGQVIPWQAREQAQGFAFDVDELRTLLRPGEGPPVGVVVVNIPHNPTGALPTPAEWQEIVDVVRAAGARLFCDEMYRGLEHVSTPEGPATTLASAVDVDDRALVLSGLSKSLSAPGLRAGWLVTRDRALLQRLAVMKDWTTLCAPAPVELLALAVLRRREELQASNRALIQKNLAVVDDVVAGDPRFAWPRPRGGSVGLLRLLREPSASAFCERVLRETGSMLVPGGLFDFGGAPPGDQHVRLGLGRASFAADFRDLVRRSDLFS